ncbi:MAG: hypothetical protein AB8E87_00470 [Prochlorococcus sp.]
MNTPAGLSVEFSGFDLAGILQLKAWYSAFHFIIPAARLAVFYASACCRQYRLWIFNAFSYSCPDLILSPESIRNLIERCKSTTLG